MSTPRHTPRVGPAPRSVAAAHAGLVPPLEPLPPGPPRRLAAAGAAFARAAGRLSPGSGPGSPVGRGSPTGPDLGRPAARASVRRRLAALLAGGLIIGAALLGAAGTRTVLAVFTDGAIVSGNTFATGSWSVATTWYLHNNPTPPVGNTTAQFNLALDGTKPTASTLYNYDTNCDSRAGRSINRNTGLVSETGACRYATWRSSALAAARTLNGTATLAIWSRKTSTGGTNPTLRAFLRVFDPATSAYTELGSADATVAANSTSAWVELTLSWSLSGVTVPAGRQVEVKLVATGGTRNVEIAHDANNLASSLKLP